MLPKCITPTVPGWLLYRTCNPLCYRSTSCTKEGIVLRWIHQDVFRPGVDHYIDVIMSPTIVYSRVYSGVDQRNHQSSAPLAFVRRIHRRPVISPHKRPVKRKMFPFDDVIMDTSYYKCDTSELKHNATRTLSYFAYPRTGIIWR